MSFSLFMALFLLMPFLAVAANVGHYRYNFGPFSIYDATLASDSGTYNPQQPFTLTLTYHRDIPGKRILNGSLDEWRKQGYSQADIDAWAPQLATFTPNINNGDTLIATRTAKGLTVTQNGQIVGSATNPQFIEAFFNLWIGPHSTEPEQRNNLLGES